jgi:choline kinase
MKAVLLAAGLAKRLRPLTDSTPKCLLDINEKNLLHRAIENIEANGIKDFIVVTGYRENMIIDYINENFSHLSFEFLSNKDYMNNNNSYSFWMTKDIAGDEILLLDSDILFEKEIIKKLIDSGKKTCLALKKHKLDEEQIKVLMDEESRVIEIGKEVDLQKAQGESIGIEIISGKFLKELYNVMDRKITRENNVNEFYEVSFQEVINRNDENISMYGVDISEFSCIEIDTVEDYENAKLNLKI